MSARNRLRARAFRTCVAITIGVVVTALGPPLTASAVAPSAPSGPVVEWPDPATAILSWTPSPGATRYNIEIADNVGFSSPIVKDTTSNTRYVPTAKLRPGTWYWHVQAVNAMGEGSGWSFSEFSSGSVPVPELDAPSNGAKLQQPESPPLLTWSMPSGPSTAGSSGIVSYKVEVSRDNFTTIKTYPAPGTSLETTSLVVPEPLSVGSWSWRVKAVKSTTPLIESQASEERSFEILPLRTPEITGPTQTAVTDVVLDWKPVPGARAYQVQVSKTTDFSSTLVDSKTVYGTSYSPPITYDNNNTYYWQVRAVDSGGNTSEWAKSGAPFKRDYPHAPTLVYPANGALDVPDPLYFDWTAVPHASRYEFQISTDSKFSPAVTSTCLVSGTTYTPGVFRFKDTDPIGVSKGENEDCEPVEGETNYWQVRALDRPFRDFSDPIEGVKGNDWSPTGSFDAGGMAITNLSTRRNGLPTISWDPVVGAASYSLKLEGPTPKTVTTYATSWTADGTTALAPGTYTLSLSAKSAFPKGVSSLVERRTFTISGTIPTAGAAPLTLLEPADGTAQPLTDIPLLRWEPWPGAAYYKVFVRNPTGNAVVGTDSLFEKPVPYPTMTDTSLELLTKAGLYTWSVVAYASNGDELGVSDPGEFRVATHPEAQGNELALGGRELDHNNPAPRTPCTPTSGPCVVPATPVFRWDPVPHAAFYIVYLAEDANFTQLVEPTFVAATTNTMWAPTVDNHEWSLGDSEASGSQTGPTSYYWFVRPCRSAAVCGTSPRSKDIAQHSFTKKSPPVTGQRTTLTDNTEATFSWDSYWHDPASPTASDKWAKTGEPLPQAGMQYRVEVYRDTTLVDRIDVDQTTYTAFTKTYGSGTFSWRVQAIDDYGNPLTWSDADPVQAGRQDASFTIAPPQVVLQSPISGTRVPGTTPFTWQAQPYTKGYDVSVHKDDGTGPFSDGNRVAYQQFGAGGSSGGVLTTAWTWNKVLPPSPAAYLWRVRRVDPSGNPGPWSEPGRFFVDAAGMTITSPLPGATEPPDGPLLRWNQVAGASTYTVDIRPQSGGAGTTDSATAIGTAFASKKAFTSGNYLASVTARDASGNAVSTAQVSFSVDSRLVALSEPQVGAPTGTAVGATLTSTDPTWNQSNVTMSYQWLRNDAVIFGATGQSYTLTALDAGKSISLRVTGKKPNYADGVATSAPVAIPAAPGTGGGGAGGGGGGALTASVSPSITGTPMVGGFLNATTGTWSVAPTSYRYQWYRAGGPIVGATSPTYRPTMSDAAQSLTVQVTTGRSGYTEGSATSAAVIVPKVVSTTTASVSPLTISKSKRAKVTIYVRANGVTGPTGKITIKDGRKKLKVLSLSASKAGKVVYKLPKLKPEKHKIKVTYGGTVQIAGSRAKVMKLIVTR